MEQSGLLLLLLFWMCSLGYHSYKPAVHSRLLLCGRGLEGREEEGLTWELYHSNVLTRSTFFLKTPDCSFNTMLSSVGGGVFFLFCLFFYLQDKANVCREKRWKIICNRAGVTRLLNTKHLCCCRQRQEVMHQLQLNRFKNDTNTPGNTENPHRQ